MYIYGLGTAIGFGIGYILFKIQDTILGFSLISPWMELNYITTGIISGKSSFSIVFRICGIAGIIASIGLFQLDIHIRRNFYKPAAFCLAIGAILFQVYLIIQYGFFYPALRGMQYQLGFQLP